MRRICRLEGAIRSYDWGSRTILAELLGGPVPSAEPQAEWWLGAHPRAPSRLRIGERSIDLREAIERDPEGVLGGALVARFGPRLPFLLKVLAVERPLSVQVHPDARQAREGFAREEARGLALEAPERCHPDDRHKPELISALTPFTALAGLRRPARIRALLARLGLAELAPEASADARGMREWLAGWLARDPAERAPQLARVGERAGALAQEEAAFAWTARLAAEHPGDPGILAPLFLNLVELDAGEGLWFPPRELHCHLHGAAVEVMADSDNVVRAALTKKHVDREELLRIACFESREPERLAPGARRQGERVYAAAAAEFELSILEVGAGEAVRFAAGHGVEILLCVGGRVRATSPSDREDVSELELRRGSAALVPAAAGAYRVEGLEGEGRLFRVAVPAQGPDPDVDQARFARASARARDSDS